MRSNQDFIAVRTDEQFDCQAMQTYLRAHIPHAEGALEVRQCGGGHANLTYLLRMGEQEWVMRRPPLGPTLPTAHDMRREFRVLAALARTDVPVPRPVGLCEDASVIGTPFYVMERRYGVVMRDAIPPEIGDDVEKRRQVSEAAVDALATLHAVDWQAVGLEDFGRPTGYLARQLRRWLEQWERATAIDYYEIPGLYKNAVILAGIYARYVTGQTHDERFAEFGRKVEMFAEVACALTQRARL